MTIVAVAKVSTVIPLAFARSQAVTEAKAKAKAREKAKARAKEKERAKERATQKTPSSFQIRAVLERRYVRVCVISVPRLMCPAWRNA